jgi:hypothetical protein
VRPLVYDPANCRNARARAACDALDSECAWTDNQCQPLAKICGFESVDATGQCDSGSHPFNGRCIDPSEPPCGGSCPSGSVCNIDVNVCEEPPVLPNSDHGCDATCGPAEILVYADPDTMLWSSCCAVACECLMLPPLSAGTWGRYSDLAWDRGQLYASGYDTTYGDLVVGTYGRASGQLETLVYVDGVDEAAEVVADPTGFRGGTAAPGPNVGTHTTLAAHNGSLRVAYHDLDGKNLRFASNRSGEWQVGLIDDGRDATGADTGDVGQFVSMVVDDTGIAHVTYYAHRVVAGGTAVTGARYARALTPDPLVYEDWERVWIDAISSCDESCAGTDRCVLDDGGPGCASPRDDCDTACACDQSCVDIGGNATCRRTLPASLEEPCGGSCASDSSCVADLPSGTICLADSDTCTGCTEEEVCVNDGTADVCRRPTPFSSVSGLPEGVGLFTSLAIYGERPTLVYYDSLLRQLRGAVAEFRFDEATLAGFVSGTLPVGCDVGSDNGRFASLAVAPDGASLGVAYQGDAGNSLWLYHGTDLTSGVAEVVDDGLRPAGPNLVGGSAALAFATAADEPLIAYANQTENDLLLASRSGDTWQITPLRSDGVYGSFARIVVDGRTAWLSTYLRERDDRGRDVSRLVITVVDLDQLP